MLFPPFNFTIRRIGNSDSELSKLSSFNLQVHKCIPLPGYSAACSEQLLWQGEPSASSGRPELGGCFQGLEYFSVFLFLTLQRRSRNLKLFFNVRNKGDPMLRPRTRESRSGHRPILFRHWNIHCPRWKWKVTFPIICLFNSDDEQGLLIILNDGNAENWQETCCFQLLHGQPVRDL